ncbi:MAG: prepilin peptidase [Reyranella sp.]|uniref:A24 family peptidase n=1 Tax=Reyranella sp. TaxID=1929291 RepID=UPI00272FF1B0|nr:prepilin peptidase [Reyranella sp.]MDP1964281.1 prepilin peptidase [Reyranella sp.]MDP2375499.1 prepilin peptidase [Reyranella sp.]
MMILSLVTSLATVGFVFAMVYAGLVDLTTMRIRNSLILALLGSYVALAPLAGFTLEEVAWSAAIAAGLLIVGFVFFARGWMGGGDAKLLAVTGLWLGFEQVPTFLVYTALFGGALTLAVLQLRLVGLPAFLGSKPWITRLQSERTGIPYGVAITLAALIVFPQTRWFAL